MHYVIIGNGVAGINGANTLRQRDSAADITVISKETDHFFARTALMYVFCGQLSEGDVEPYERDHYRRMAFRRERAAVTRLDPAARSLELDDGRTLTYDRLLIAAGSVPRRLGIPGEELEAVGNFVTWQNLEWLRDRIRRGQRAVIIGGGLIGIEVAEILREAGLAVTFLIREDWFWPIALDEREGMMVTEHMRHHGIDVRLQTEAAAVLDRAGTVTGVRLTSGDDIPADLVVITIGVVPQTDWLAGSGIEVDKTGGIVVNEYLETSQPGIWAAGDCTSVVWFNGVRRPEQLWYTARDQGLAAGRNITGEKTPYRRGTFYNSAKFFDLEYTTAGYVNFNFEGETNWYRREGDAFISERITCRADGSVLGFNMIGRRWDHRPLVRWVEEKRPLDYALDHLASARFDEEFWPALPVFGAARQEG
jgi:NADPH-dependent 2,4-dienoyl-CoA reductase/sulfur reductase-like enzyme